eukprot:1794588-Amphidinium_carterae.1
MAALDGRLQRGGPRLLPRVGVGLEGGCLETFQGFEVAPLELNLPPVLPCLISYPFNARLQGRDSPLALLARRLIARLVQRSTAGMQQPLRSGVHPHHGLPVLHGHQHRHGRVCRDGIWEIFCLFGSSRAASAHLLGLRCCEEGWRCLAFFTPSLDALLHVGCLREGPCFIRIC